MFSAEPLPSVSGEGSALQGQQGAWATQLSCGPAMLYLLCSNRAHLSEASTMSALATGTPGVLAAPEGYSRSKVGQLRKAPAQGWFHGCGTSESHRGRPCVWGLMLCISHLEILNHFVLEFTFFKGSLMGQWKLQGTWSPGHAGSSLPQPSCSLGHVRSSPSEAGLVPPPSCSFPVTATAFSPQKGPGHRHWRGWGGWVCASGSLSWQGMEMAISILG